MKTKITEIFPQVADVLDEKNFLIKINRPITPDFADTCVEAIHTLAKKSKLINVLINGDHGYTNEMIRIVEALMAYDRPDYCVTGYAKRAYGTHFVILMGCKVPIGFPESRFRLGRFVADPKFYKEITRKDKISEQSMFEFIAARTGNNIEELYQLADKRTVLTSEQAFQKNFLRFVQKTPPLT